MRSRHPSSTKTNEEASSNICTNKSAPEKVKVTKISDLKGLLSQFNLHKYWICVIPPFKVWENEFKNICVSSSKTLFKNQCPYPQG